jgi:LCP family protein required for cell wall assembly
MNILLIGSDKSDIPDDPGRSDTQLLVRLDPETKSISMFSVPRDLRVYIPDHGYDKMNTAYSYGGPALAVKTFKELTGLPVNHFVETDFAGFWHVVNILGGVYIPVDHRYFVPASADYKSINLEPGYQLVRGKQALNYVRYRHDQKGDFTRMQRQQLFLKELQRQSGRWSSDWGKVVKLIKAITGETKSDLDSLKKLQPLVALGFQVDTSKVYQVHLEGATPMIGGVSYVEASETEIAAAVNEFTHPVQAPTQTKAPKVGKKTYTVKVYNGSGIPGLATTTASQLQTQGYRAEALADVPEYPDKVTAVYAPKSLSVQAKAIGALLWPSDVRLVERAPGVSDDITVFVASSFSGTITIPEEQLQEQQTLQKNQRYDWSSWRTFDQQTPLHLEAPTAWSPGLTYDEFHPYSVKTTEGKKVAAAVAVINTPMFGYASIQAMRWLDPPAIENPNSVETIKGTKYMLFYQGSHLHMVAWKRRGALYWMLNTLDNELSNDVMMGLATSFKPVK